jgi:hypothetical protein
MKSLNKKIEKIELIKVETGYNPKRKLYYYNLYLQDIAEPLLIGGIQQPISEDYVGKKIKYKLTDDLEVKEFELFD